MSSYLIPQIVPMFGPGGHGLHGSPFMGLPFLLIAAGVTFWLLRTGRLQKFCGGANHHPGHHGGPGRPHGWAGGPSWFSPLAEAEKTLALRLANGDITPDEYRERLHTLRNANPVPGGYESTYEPPFTPPADDKSGPRRDAPQAPTESGSEGGPDATPPKV